jgi:hypothetical protein
MMSVIFTGILQLFFIVILHPLPCHALDRSYNEALPCRLHLHDVNRHLIKVQDIDEDLVQFISESHNPEPHAWMKGKNIKQLMSHIPCGPQGQDVLLLQNAKPNEINGLWRESRPENGSNPDYSRRLSEVSQPATSHTVRSLLNRVAVWVRSTAIDQGQRGYVDHLKN